MVFDLIDGETRERSWSLLQRGGVLVSTLSDPSEDKAKEHGVRAMRYTVTAGKVKPHVAKTFALEQASDSLAEVEKGHSVGRSC
jgi:hypothetical protein